MDSDTDPAVNVMFRRQTSPSLTENAACSVPCSKIDVDKSQV